jgi:hypothetical protein
MPTKRRLRSVPGEFITLVISAYVYGDGQHRSIIVNPNRRSQIAKKVVARIDRTLPVFMAQYVVVLESVE